MVMPWSTVRDLGVGADTRYKNDWCNQRGVSKASPIFSLLHVIAAHG